MNLIIITKSVVSCKSQSLTCAFIESNLNLTLTGRTSIVNESMALSSIQDYTKKLGSAARQQTNSVKTFRYFITTFGKS